MLKKEGESFRTEKSLKLLFLTEDPPFFGPSPFPPILTCLNRHAMHMLSCIAFCIIAFKKFIHFALLKLVLVHFAFKTLLYFPLMLLYFASVLHFTTIITFCAVTV